MSDKPEIYFHVGLGKIASTYMQMRLFPKLEGIKYIPTVKYKKHSKQIIAKGGHDKFLVSREFDRQFEREVRWFTETYPEAHIIVLFRRHGSWIASQYRRFVKNGWYWDFNKFLDLEKDEGMWKQEDLLFYPKLKVIEECCQHKPLILFHDEIKADSWAFFDRICKYTGTSYTKEKISTKRVHTSYTEKQLLFLRAYCRKFKKNVPRPRTNKVLHWLLYRPWWAFFHLIMYIAAVLPNAWIPKGPLVMKEELDKVDKAFEEDWQKVVDYAKKNNAEIGV